MHVGCSSQSEADIPVAACPRRGARPVRRSRRSRHDRVPGVHSRRLPLPRSACGVAGGRRATWPPAARPTSGREADRRTLRRAPPAPEILFAVIANSVRLGQQELAARSSSAGKVASSCGLPFARCAPCPRRVQPGRLARWLGQGLGATMIRASGPTHSRARPRRLGANWVPELPTKSDEVCLPFRALGVRLRSRDSLRPPGPRLLCR
jgi:hypothetical protein